MKMCKTVASRPCRRAHCTSSRNNIASANSSKGTSGTEFWSPLLVPFLTLPTPSDEDEDGSPPPAAACILSVCLFRHASVVFAHVRSVSSSSLAPYARSLRPVSISLFSITWESKDRSADLAFGSAFLKRSKWAPSSAFLAMASPSGVRGPVRVNINPIGDPLPGSSRLYCCDGSISPPSPELACAVSEMTVGEEVMTSCEEPCG
mmetsp:Transcript_10841/g.26571  ORF Transcript_10841/g.26571 Transcript_10841/m.26571 type:complete len:205 (-) Transcript_10841:2431-3045(-)